ncbi:hypothetical protein PC41400_24855 [Paenibacillus chitinolyticus]|uniref:Uncharacterized protein n=1 Tax=Paenibacillus chitinolyticus TaxID=79263 RepID=A0A410X2A2_9BACL|nr:hypothetical protein PC41400_24855 [Paenibacillus chitinolyticus]
MFRRRAGDRQRRLFLAGGWPSKGFSRKRSGRMRRKPQRAVCAAASFAAGIVKRAAFPSAEGTKITSLM